MPKIVNIDADTEPEDNSLKALEAEHAAAQKAFDKLRAERQKKRAKLSRDQFREYNTETADDQIAAQTRLADAEKRLSRALGRANQQVAVGAATSKEKGGKS